MNMSGAQFTKSYVNDEVRDQKQALQLYKQAATKFKDDTHVEMYINESIPMVESHVKTAELLQRHMEQKISEK